MTTAEAEAPVAEVIRLPLMSGHCATHRTQGVGQTLTDYAAVSHQHCVDRGSGNRANPWKEFQPCPCPHHYLNEDGTPPERYECSECGKDIIAVPFWPRDEDGDERYGHIDSDGRVLGEECHAVSRNRTSVMDTMPEPEPVVKDCTRCGNEFTPVGRERICPDCKSGPVTVSVDFEDDLSEFDEAVDDDFSDLDDID